MSETYPQFVLTIYTWPTLSGAPCEAIESRHPKPEEAIAALDAYDKPYWLATLAKDDGYGHCWPCREDGGTCYPPDFRGAFRRSGTNGTHPARLAMIADWQRLVALTNQRAGSDGLIAAAREVLAESHPLMTACAEELAQAAYGPSDHHHTFVPAVADVLHRMHATGEDQDTAVRALGGTV